MCESNLNLRSWRDVRKEFFSPEEIAESDERVKELAQAKANYDDLKARGNDAIGGNALELLDSLLTEEEIAESDMTIEELARLKGVSPAPPQLDATKWTKEQFDAEIEKGLQAIREGRVTPLEDFVEELKREGRL